MRAIGTHSTARIILAFVSIHSSAIANCVVLLVNIPPSRCVVGAAAAAVVVVVVVVVVDNTEPYCTCLLDINTVSCENYNSAAHSPILIYFPTYHSPPPFPFPFPSTLFFLFSPSSPSSISFEVNHFLLLEQRFPPKV